MKKFIIILILTCFCAPHVFAACSLTGAACSIDNVVKNEKNTTDKAMKKDHSFNLKNNEIKKKKIEKVQPVKNTNKKKYGK